MDRSELIPENCEKGETLKYRGRRVGLFACMLEIIALVDVCEEEGIQFEIDIALGLYSLMSHEKGTNWWEYYFEPIRAKNKSETHNFDRKKCLSALHTCYKLPLERKREIIKQFIKPLPDIQRTIDTFASFYNIEDRYGLHYRGTDKVTEGAILFPAEYAVDKINSVDGGTEWKLFIATDSQDFLNRMITILGEDRVAYTSCTRSDNHRPVHVANKAGNQVVIGEEAVRDCFLLAKCKRFFGTTSNLSTAANLLSNRPHEDFIQLTVQYREEQKEWRSSRKKIIMDKLEILGIEEKDIVLLQWLIEDGGV